MGGLWQYYRFDFYASTGGTAKTPSASYEWNLAKSDWVQRPLADAPVDMSDAHYPVFLQIDTSSSDSYAQNSTNIDINIAGAAVNLGTTDKLGCRFDNASSGYFSEIKALPDGLITSMAITSTPPWIKFRFDDNTTGVGSSFVFLSFRREYS